MRASTTSVATTAAAGAAPAPAHLGEAEIRALEPAMRAFARRAVGDAAAAQDLVQEALMAAVQSLAGFDGRSQVRTWVIGILSHKVIDYLRRTRVRRWESDDAIDDDVLTSGGRTPESELSDKQALGVLERALATLPDRERMAVMLCDVEGLDRDEVCNALGVRATHLRVLLHRARHRLRKALEDAGV
jgi:RNA polymerase sigma-70 factor (ECF subfamily)